MKTIVNIVLAGECLPAGLRHDVNVKRGVDAERAVYRWPVTRKTQPMINPITAPARASFPAVDSSGHDSTISQPRNAAGISRKIPVQCHGKAKPMIIRTPSINGTSKRGREFRKKSGPTLARSSDPRQPGAYALLDALFD